MNNSPFEYVRSCKNYYSYEKQGRYVHKIKNKGRKFTKLVVSTQPNVLQVSPYISVVVPPSKLYSLRHYFWDEHISRNISLLTSIYGIGKKEKNICQISIDSALIDELSKHFNDLTRNFDDLEVRHTYFSKIKYLISELWNIKREKDYYSELLILINQAIEGINSENLLDDEKIINFKDALSRLKQSGITEEDIEDITEKLIKCRIPLISPISGLSELYD
ncbi:hypothetical protein BMS3Bbin15_00067 [archaeon BMS3Bbin15]|nr:hypothetical protein BMS3Bbin15_00067 [archaeon BMS3Bbin15]